MNRLLDHPRLLGLLCGAGAVALGLAFMAAAGAPERYLVVNLAAFVLGAALWLALRPRAGAYLLRNGAVVLALAVPLIGTALFGAQNEGASRWVSVGPLSLQTSLIVLPAMIVLYARKADLMGTFGIAIAAVALAVQPDRAMAGVLAAGIGAVLLMKQSRLAAFACAAALAAFAVTMFRPDELPAVPFVDLILYTAFDVHLLAGVAVVAGCFILLIPAMAGVFAVPRDGAVIAGFGACWAAVIAAAALGNYPTPLVGYGGSAVIGYLLSVALLPGSRPRRAEGPLPAIG
jgi:cell division protein FtsW (lipid II flippase)